MPQSETPPDFYTGSPIDPSDLWFRDEFISDLWETLETEHALLTAPRRTGKTSVMDHLVAFPKNDFSPVPVFVQDLDHPAELILTLLDAFHDRHSGLFRKSFAVGSSLFGKAFEKIKEVGAGGFKIALREADPNWQQNWKKNGDDFLRRARKAGHRLLFIVDEFPISSSMCTSIIRI